MGMYVDTATYFADDVLVDVYWYPVDGVQITVCKLINGDWETVVNSRFIADSFWEAMCDALSYAGYDFDNANAQCYEWEIFEPDEEEEN